MGKNDKSLKLNNSGSTLVTVIVVVTFLSILVTMILYLSGANYMMKKTNRDTVENFYDTETALEQIKTGFCEVASEAADKAYVDTMIRYSASSAFGRGEIFEKAFFEELEKIWDEKATGTTHAAVIESWVDTSKYTFSMAVNPDADPGDPLFDGSMDMSRVDDGYVFVRGITIELEGDKGYYTKIDTDFVFTAPKMNWSLSYSYSSLDDVSGSETPDERHLYDIADYVNYFNWVKSGD